MWKFEAVWYKNHGSRRKPEYEEIEKEGDNGSLELEIAQ